MASRRKPLAREPGPPGQAVRRTGKDGPQVIETTGKRWSDEAEKRFLDHLAASCNVTTSAAATGFSTAAIYKRRRDDPGFADRWQAALEQGYARIEMALVRSAADTMEGFAPDPSMPLPAMTVAEAIAVLGQHRRAVMGGQAGHGWRARPRSLAELGDDILRKLEVIERVRAQA